MAGSLALPQQRIAKLQFTGLGLHQDEKKPAEAGFSQIHDPS